MKKRYWIYLCLLGLIALQIFVPPVLPVIQLPGEVIMRWPGGSEFLGGWFAAGLTNSFVGATLAAIIVLIIAFAARARSRTAEEVPTGFYNFIEMIIELAYGYVENTVGKSAKMFFPFFMTFILWIVIANWMELVPGVDSIGKWENLPHFQAEGALEAAEEALHDGATPLEVVRSAPISQAAQDEIAEHFHLIGEDGEPADVHLSEAELEELVVEIEHTVDHEVDEANIGDMQNGVLLTKASTTTDADGNAVKSDEADWTIVPFVRAAATDLNFTLAMAFISVVMTQYYGMKAQGMKYWRKFFPFYAGKGDEIAKNPLAIMDIGVGLLEFISEIFKIVSFAFRLLGNIFAGQVLLFVIASLLPIANLLFWHLEFGVHLLQGVVFALLTLTFMQGATESHHGEEH